MFEFIDSLLFQQFTPVYKLHSVQKTDKLNGTSDPPITDGACISWSNDSVEYRIQAIGYDNIETFDEDGIKVLFMIGDLVKIMVLETGNVWLCQFSTARWARQFNSENGPGESTDVIIGKNILDTILRVNAGILINISFSRIYRTSKLTF